MRKIDTVFFDLDDTLVAFDAVTDISWEQVLDDYIKYNNKYSSDKLFEIIRKHSSLFWNDENRHREGRLDIVNARRKTVVSAFNELSLPEKDAIKVADQYSKIRIDNMYIFTETEEVLTYLKDNCFKLALITNGDSATQRGKIKRFVLERYFDCILIEGEFGFGKPDYKVFSHALRELDSTHDSAVMIGDNLNWDIARSQALGVRAIWHDWKKAGLPESSRIKPDHKIDSLLQIIDILNNNKLAK